MDIAATRGGRERAARTRQAIVDPAGAHRSHPHGFVPDAPAVVAGGAVTALSSATLTDAPADAYRIAHPLARVAKRTLDIAGVVPLLVLLVLVVNRGGWAAHVFGSLLVGLAVYFGTAGIAALLFTSRAVEA